MPKFKVHLIGTLKFDRTVMVRAINDDDAGIIAEEMLKEQLASATDEFECGEVYVDEV
jgi:hypothetical protein